jgi:hypothetical protein
MAKNWASSKISQAVANTPLGQLYRKKYALNVSCNRQTPTRQFSPCMEGIAAPYISKLPFCLSGNLMSSKAMPIYAFDIREA